MTKAPPHYHFYPLGDAALLIHFANKIDEAINREVLQLFRQFIQNPVPGILDIVPAYGSLTVFYDAFLLSKNLEPYSSVFDRVVALVQERLFKNDAVPTQQRQVRIPVCYEEKFAPDLQELAALRGLRPDEIVQLHASQTYRVYMIGFLPGFAYMGTVAERLEAPRKKEPRTTVAAGSVGIAGKQTGIYPVDSPGGWQIIGRTPVVLFDKTAPQPVLFQPGDEVTFYPITAHEFENYQGRSC